MKEVQSLNIIKTSLRSWLHLVTIIIILLIRDLLKKSLKRLDVILNISLPISREILPMAFAKFINWNLWVELEL
ncbi:MAG TPA: hypothetical protein OIM39_07875 [Bacteroidaceae bacterium]|nr:hypothetical protein [Bacteroidaceae bacterium]